MQFLKTTLVGGVGVLLPVAFVVWMFGKVFVFVTTLATPLAQWLAVDKLPGVIATDLLTLMAIVLFCFGAGLLARSRFVSGIIESMEARLLYSIPGYNFMKGMTRGVASSDAETPLSPVLVRYDDASQVAFQVESLDDGRVVVYVPGAPDPWSGAIQAVDAGRVEALEATMPGVVRAIRGLGRDFGELQGPARQSDS